MSKLVKMKVSMAGAFESYSPGDLILISDEAAAAWAEAGIADIHEDELQKVKEMEDTGDIGELKHLGGGVFELPNGEKVRGKVKALEVLEELKAQSQEHPQEDSEHDDEAAGNTAEGDVEPDADNAANGENVPADTQ